MRTFRKIIFPGLREVKIDNMIENIVAFLKTLAGIFYLVVRRPMLFFKDTYAYIYICMFAMFIHILFISLCLLDDPTQFDDSIASVDTYPATLR